MILSRFTLKNIPPGPVQVPDESLFRLPEKVLQFGTGVLLRGLPDYYIDKANRAGRFNGRVVAVKSTGQGDAAAFDRQDALYTLCVRGVHEGNAVAENVISSAISRVLHAQHDWDQVLACAHDPNIQVILSNTTEVGIQLVNDDIRRHPPVSFPGKLLAWLYERFRAFGGSAHSGMVIVPTELVPDNGRKLESILLELAHLNSLPEEFIEWLEQHNRCCSSLVDRIVPGAPGAEAHAALEAELGYADGLLCMTEVYSLWAIEGDARVRQALGFADANPEMHITPDITLFRELKLRLLNGTHTLCCGPAVLTGIETVRQAMEDSVMARFVRQLMENELANAIPYTIDPATVTGFAGNVLDRFRNPHIRHSWRAIATQYSSKLRMRCLPMLLEHYRVHGTPPPLMAAGFAAYLLYMRTRRDGGKYFGEYQGQAYEVTDDQAAVLCRRWEALPPEGVVTATLDDKAFWETDLLRLPGWPAAVTAQLRSMVENGVAATLAPQLVAEKPLT